MRLKTKGHRYFPATNIPASPKPILRFYKWWWGIETSYRKIREFLPKTTSRSWIVRVFNFTLACLFYNAWVVLNARTQTPITTITIRLSYIWSSLILMMTMKTEASPG